MKSRTGHIYKQSMNKYIRKMGIECFKTKQTDEIFKRV